MVFFAMVAGRDVGSAICPLSTPLLHQQSRPSFFFFFDSSWAAAMW
jgi:hypothetical protein